MSILLEKDRRKLKWRRNPILNEDTPEPYKIPNCRCQVGLSECEVEGQWDRGLYTKGDLVNDLNIFFNYLPESEVSRMVNVMIWCLSTGLKNRGGIDLKDFAVITVEEKTYSRPLTQVTRDCFGVAKRVSRAPKKRYFVFREYPQLKAVVVPRTPDFFPGHERTWFTWKVSATNHPYYYARHWRRGALYMQQVFDKTFEYTGYTDEYIEMAQSNIIEPFGTEREHMNTVHLGFETPPYVKAAYTDELIKVPLNCVSSKYFTSNKVKYDVMFGKMTKEEASKHLLSKPRQLAIDKKED